MKIVHIVGARPQFIKAVMVSRAWEGRGEEVILHTGQHFSDNMSRLFFKELEIKEPDFNLDAGGGTHAEQTAAMLLGVDHHLVDLNPDWVVIYGDTNSTLAGALAAAKLRLPLAHVEAGLRSFNRDMPEEVNRVICDRVSNLLFCPTTRSVTNLANEGIQYGVHHVGDVMADALFHFAEVSRKKSKILARLNLKPKQYALVTLHRSGNVDRKNILEGIIKGLGMIDFPLVFPVHPRTRKMLKDFKITLPDNIFEIAPTGYLDMLKLEQNADAILTDSGGIQKEAYLLGVRCITLRGETEWVETVEEGWNLLAGTNYQKIYDSFYHFHPRETRQEIFGDGKASESIVKLLFSK